MRFCLLSSSAAPLSRTSRRIKGKIQFLKQGSPFKAVFQIIQISPLLHGNICHGKRQSGELVLTMHSAPARCTAWAMGIAIPPIACAATWTGHTGSAHGIGRCLYRQGGGRCRPTILLAVVLYRHLSYMAEQLFADAVAWSSVFSVVIHNYAQILSWHLCLLVPHFTAEDTNGA